WMPAAQGSRRWNLIAGPALRLPYLDLGAGLGVASKDPPWVVADSANPFPVFSVFASVARTVALRTDIVLRATLVLPFAASPPEFTIAVGLQRRFRGNR